jgi:hypothetical protein
MMNWEAVSAIAEIAGLITVIASLIYIGAQSRQANIHATANAEVAWLHAWNQIGNSWVSDERTTSVIRNGFGSFNSLSKSDQALFQARVGSTVNHWILAKGLSQKGLISSDIMEEVNKIVIAILSTPGGLEYWEHDSKATPGGDDLLMRVKEQIGRAPNFIEMMPWWAPDSDRT